MRILYLDIDTLRPDHLGCYGYHRNTSPNIDRLAHDGVRFDKCYVSDAPCLPSRASFFSGQFGIHTGVVGHGGTAADMRLIGPGRTFSSMRLRPSLTWCMRLMEIYPVSFSPFAERHSAWWFCEGWREFTNPGRFGAENADEVSKPAIDWIKANGERDNWFLHVNMWDPHTNYTTPKELANAFADEPLEGWYTEEMRQRQWGGFGPGGPQEPGGNMGGDYRCPTMPNHIKSLADYKTWVDGYDRGIANADLWVGRILNALADRGILDDTLIMVSSDHGENFGELGVIGDHATADHITSRVPMILRHPRLGGGRVDDALHYQTDVGATLVELAGEVATSRWEGMHGTGGVVPACWDGRSFAPALKAGRSEGRPNVVFSQNAWSCQRSVRWDNYVFIRTYDTGLRGYPAHMLFDIAKDPHELNDLAPGRPDLVAHGRSLIAQWTDEMMRTNASQIDPMWTVMAEGGPYHTRGKLESYCQRLRQTGRAHHAEFLQAHPTGL
ncbi:MAG: sulfatase [Phycisphaerae bacterium]